MAKADLLKRIVAYLVDGMIGGVLAGLVVGAALLIFFMGIFVDSNTIMALTTIVYVIGIFGGIFLSYIYYLLRDGVFKGGSPGKKLLGLRVINVKTNQPSGIKDSVLRNITLLIPIVSFIEIILPLVDEKGLRLGDKLANTQVVDA